MGFVSFAGQVDVLVGVGRQVRMLYVGRLHHGNETRGDTHECCTAEPARSSTYASKRRAYSVAA